MYIDEYIFVGIYMKKEGGAMGKGKSESILSTEGGKGEKMRA